jgi:hypothetical protein
MPVTYAWHSPRNNAGAVRCDALSRCIHTATLAAGYASSLTLQRPIGCHMNWEAITAMSTLFTGIVIAVTAIVAIAQLQHLRAQRRDAAAIELIRSLQDPELARAFTLVMSLPPGISADELHAKGPQYVQAANVIGLRFEMLGVLVHRGAVAFDVAEDLTQGGVLGAWARLEKTAQHTRKTQHLPLYLEWFQWLAEQFEKHGSARRAPAPETYRDWTPGKA